MGLRSSIAAVVFTVGALPAALAPSVAVLVAARFIIGLAVGSAALVVPLYLSEIAPTEIRGAIASLNQLMIVGGILAAFIVNAILASSGRLAVDVGVRRGSVARAAGGDGVHARDAAVSGACR